jgi:hypothetical protein
VEAPAVLLGDREGEAVSASAVFEEERTDWRRSDLLLAFFNPSADLELS